MSIGNAIILGLIDGLTEFLPVSRTGHMSILQHLFSMTMPQDGHMLFDALLRLAALITVCLICWGDMGKMLREAGSLLRPAENGQRVRRPWARLLIMVLVATLPLLLKIPFLSGMRGLSSNSFYIGAAMVLSGCLLYVTDKMLPGKKGLTGITLSDSLLIGLCHLVGSFPGFSRSGAAISGGIALGLDREFAVRFSFLIAIPSLFISFISSLIEAFSYQIDWASLPAYLVGMVAALLAGLLATGLLRLAARKGKFGGYAYYCWVAGVLSVILTLIF